MVVISKRPSVILDEKALCVICDEVITYVLNTNEGPLQPGNTTIIINNDSKKNGIDAIIQVKCCFFQDRYSLSQEKSDLIRELIIKAYKETRTGFNRGPNEIEVSVWVEFLSVAYSGPEEELHDKFEMTESAMLERIRSRCGFNS